MGTGNTIQRRNTTHASRRPTFAKHSSKFARTICKLSKLSQEILLMAIGTMNMSGRRGSASVDFTVPDFAEAFRKRNVSTTYFNQQVFRAVMLELAKVICYENLESFYEGDAQHYRGTAYPLCYKAEVDTSRNVHIEFNPRALANIRELRPYAIIGFENAARIRGKHAFNIYKYALSQQGFAGRGGNRRRTWWFEVSVEYLRAFLGVEDGRYREANDLKVWCVERPVAEINRAGVGIRIGFEPVRRGKSIAGFRFECADTSPAGASREPAAGRAAAGGGQEAEWARMEGAFGEEWARFYAEERASTPPDLFMDEVARKKTYERMAELGFRP